MGFPPRWCLWIRGCLEAAKASVLINGSPTDEFKCSRGLRQGDPLSPLLFTIAMEPFSRFLVRAVNLKFFSDDVLVLSCWDKDDSKNIMRILRAFSIISGLNVNVSKSLLYGVGIDDDAWSNYALSLGFKKGTFPINYLGLPIGVSMNRATNWKPVIATFQKSLSAWKARRLSMEGRVTIIQSAGDANVKKINWVAWASAIGPKKVGGLGIGALKAANVAMLFKWWWRYRTETRSLWRKAIHAIHSGGSSGSELPLKKSISGIWKYIVSVGAYLYNWGIIPEQVLDDGKFTVSPLRKKLDDILSTPLSVFFKWNNLVPKKVILFNWRAKLERLPTLTALATNGIVLASTSCVMCEDLDETM